VPGGVWPWWLERQRDTRSPAFVPRGTPALVSNVTGRTWTAIGTVGSAARAIVDPAGAITPWPDGWSLDWWVGSGDRWHFPSRESTTRQVLIDSAPVIETRVRVPGGDVASVAYVVVGPAELGDLAVMEVTNRSPVPVALALVVRPANPDRVVVVERIDLVDRLVVVDDRQALILPRAPVHTAWSSAAGADLLRSLEGGATDGGQETVRCSEGLAQAAFVFPLPHTASIRVAMPLVARRRRRGGASCPTVSLSGSSTVARGWDAHGRAGTRLVLPKGRMADALKANRPFLSLAAALHAGPPGPGSFDFALAARVVDALDRSGLEADAAEVLLSYPDRQHADGTFGGVGSTAAALVALAGHWNLTRDDKVLEATLPAVALAVGAMARRHPASPVAGWEAALRGAAEMLLAGEHGDVASRAESVASRAPAERARPVWETAGPAVVHPDGLDVRATLDMAGEELAAGDPNALDRLRWLLEVASPTFTWPAVLHPSSGGGSGGDGHDSWVAAGFISLVTQLVAGDHARGQLAVFRLWPPEWDGEGVEVHDAPTGCGRLSLALRWHGPRPALLWDLVAHGRGAVGITAPGLDPEWSTMERSGEALLSPRLSRQGDQ